MHARLAGLSRSVVAFSLAALVAACCCGRRDPCCPPSHPIPPCYSTTFQRLVVTNKHTKPVLVTPAASYIDPNTGSRVGVPFSPTSASIAAGASATFDVETSNVDYVQMSYLADDDTDQQPYVEQLTIGNGVIESQRCIVRYRTSNDTYLIDSQCP